eukprot:CAMPEP_0115002084 /NCGR_PEP_ID=MMETSP0216-20121206/17791_1 /TAXON_ID=223996 /ORGANISM="Protocruzia adherens, Strain Boccale" /LENGTH=397 /DNA_ID=CAMNT_0002367603 /DNA_START=1 /DNA_END=1194 /DNA_ORIENTATION=+
MDPDIDQMVSELRMDSYLSRTKSMNTTRTITFLSKSSINDSSFERGNSSLEALKYARTGLENQHELVVPGLDQLRIKSLMSPQLLEDLIEEEETRAEREDSEKEDLSNYNSTASARIVVSEVNDQTLKEATDYENQILQEIEGSLLDEVEASKKLDLIKVESSRNQPTDDLIERRFTAELSTYYKILGKRGILRMKALPTPTFSSLKRSMIVGRYISGVIDAKTEKFTKQPGFSQLDDTQEIRLLTAKSGKEILVVSEDIRSSATPNALQIIAIPAAWFQIDRQELTARRTHRVINWQLLGSSNFDIDFEKLFSIEGLLPSQVEGASLLRARYDFNIIDQRHLFHIPVLSLKIGDLVVLTDIQEKGIWAEGYLVDDPDRRLGVFPASFTQKLGAVLI